MGSRHPQAPHRDKNCYTGTDCNVQSGAMRNRQGRRRIIGLFLLGVALILTISFPESSLRAQSTTPVPTLQPPDAPCGVVDAIAYPIDGISTEHDDFGLYRAGFGGLHTGIDMAFGR